MRSSAAMPAQQLRACSAERGLSSTWLSESIARSHWPLRGEAAHCEIKLRQGGAAQGDRNSMCSS